MGRSSTFFVVIVTCAAGSLGGGHSPVYASTVILPGVRLACTITCARPLKRLRFVSFVRLLAVGIAIAHADQRPFSCDFEVDGIVCGWNCTSFVVESLHCQHGNIFSVCIDFAPIRCEADCDRFPCSLPFFGEHDFAIFCAAGFQHAGFVRHAPFKMRQALDLLAIPGSFR